MAETGFDILKELGISSDDLKGKNKKDIYSLIFEKSKAKQEIAEIEAQNDTLDNYKKKLPELIKALEEPFELYVTEVGQKKSPTIVKVAGYWAPTGQVLTSYNGKLYGIKNEHIIKTAEELEKAKERKPRGGSRKKA
jgi:hypothetical protein